MMGEPLSKWDPGDSKAYQRLLKDEAAASPQFLDNACILNVARDTVTKKRIT